MRKSDNFCLWSRTKLEQTGKMYHNGCSMMGLLCGLATPATAAPVDAEEAAQPDQTLTFGIGDVHRSHPEAVVAFRVFELESEVGGWIADSAEGCWARVSKPHNYRDHDVVRLGAESTSSVSTRSTHG